MPYGRCWHRRRRSTFILAPSNRADRTSLSWQFASRYRRSFFRSVRVPCMQPHVPRRSSLQACRSPWIGSSCGDLRLTNRVRFISFSRTSFNALFAQKKAPVHEAFGFRCMPDTLRPFCAIRPLLAEPLSIQIHQYLIAFDSDGVYSERTRGSE